MDLKEIKDIYVLIHNWGYQHYLFMKTGGEKLAFSLAVLGSSSCLRENFLFPLDSFCS